jgi:DNA-binding MarR family transcriptional regulator
VADVSAATVTQMLALERADLVKRVRSDRDKRVVLTSLTQRGRTVVERRREELEPRWRSTLGEFSGDELRTAAAVLDRMREMFDGLALEPQRYELVKQP